MGKRIAMVSALGGQGCTLSAAYVGTALAESGRTVTMLDLCGFGGTLVNTLGVAEFASMNAGDVLRGECSCEEALVPCDMPGLSVLPPMSFVEGFVDPYSVDLLELVRSLSEEDYVIADLPSGALPNDAAVDLYNLFIICSRPNKFALDRAAVLRRIIENLRTERGTSCEVRLLLTFFSPDEMHGSGAADIDECIDRVGARLLGIIPFDRNAEAAFRSGKSPDAICELMSFSRDIACRLSGERIPLDSRKNLFSQ